MNSLFSRLVDKPELKSSLHDLTMKETVTNDEICCKIICFYHQPYHFVSFVKAASKEFFFFFVNGFYCICNGLLPFVTFSILIVRGGAVEFGEIVEDFRGGGSNFARELRLVGGRQVGVVEHQVAVDNAAAGVLHVLPPASDCSEP